MSTQKTGRRELIAAAERLLILAQGIPDETTEPTLAVAVRGAIHSAAGACYSCEVALSMAPRSQVESQVVPATLSRPVCDCCSGPLTYRDLIASSTDGALDCQSCRRIHG